MACTCIGMPIRLALAVMSVVSSFRPVDQALVAVRVQRAHEAGATLHRAVRLEHGAALSHNVCAHKAEGVHEALVPSLSAE